jgi:hypothetical protein
MWIDWNDSTLTANDLHPNKEDSRKRPPNLKEDLLYRKGKGIFVTKNSASGAVYKLEQQYIESLGCV